MYSQDYDENMPYSFNYYIYTGSTTGTLVWWEDATQPYLRNSQIFICPSESTPTSYSYGRSQLPSMGYPATLLTSYAANESVLATKGATIVPPTALASFADPATTILLTDILAPNMEVSATSSDSQTVNASRIDKRHLDGANFLFADGHVKWEKQTLASMWTLAAD